MEISKATDEELIAAIEAMKSALKATLGQPHDGREERKDEELPKQIEAMEAELERRRTDRP